MDGEYLIGIIAVVSLFVILPGMIFHYITLWRKQRQLMPDDEKMLEDLWRSAKRMERRIETLEALMDNEGARKSPASRHPASPDYSQD